MRRIAFGMLLAAAALLAEAPWRAAKGIKVMMGSGVDGSNLSRW